MSSRHGKRAPDTASITFTLPESAKEELRRLAKADRRTLSNYIRDVLEDLVQKGKRPSVANGDKR